MDLATTLQAITQFHSILDQLMEQQSVTHEILAKMQKGLDHVVAKVDDLSNRLGVWDNVRERLNTLIAAEKGVSCRPST